MMDEFDLEEAAAAIERAAAFICIASDEAKANELLHRFERAVNDTKNKSATVHMALAKALTISARLSRHPAITIAAIAAVAAKCIELLDEDEAQEKAH